MVYHPETSQGHEASKIASIAVPYLQGRFLDLGCGDDPVWHSAIGVDNYKTFRNTSGIKADIADLSIFASESCDAVFSSHALEDFDPSKVNAVLKEWLRVVKFGGHLVLYVPSANLYPKCGSPHANPAHKWDIYPGDIETRLKTIIQNEQFGLELLESEERNGTNEYSLFIVVKKIKDCEWRENVWQRNPNGQKRCLVIRYGAFGDMIQTTSIFPLIKMQGYHLTLNCKPVNYDLLKHDPNIDEWILQDSDFVPNEQLAPYWESISERYDRVINLCESIEGALLTMPGRLQHEYPNDVRRSLYSDVNYQQRLHQLAGVTTDPLFINPRFYATDAELRKANAVRKAWTGDSGVPVICWALTGTSLHKTYPFLHEVIKMLLQFTPCHIALMGDAKEAKMLQDELILPFCENNERLHPLCGNWTMRESIAFAMKSDLVIGPETGLLNAVAMEDVPKVIYLSHSTKKNLTEYWVKTTTLIPDQKETPCYPCHRMHFDWSRCHKVADTQAALCATNFKPKQIFQAVLQVFNHDH